MIPHDYHMHTEFSSDSKTPMEVMCLAAMERGIPEIGFTEHFDLHPLAWPRDWYKPKPWWDELTRCRALFGDELVIRAGLEVGEPHMFQKQVQALLDVYPFDYLMGSLHWVGTLNVFDRAFFDRPMDEAYREYYVELEYMTSVGGFDILSHFDVPVRLGFHLFGNYFPRRYEDVIRPVLRNCIRHGISLDINTAAMRSRAKVLTPGLDILRWYVEMGGERVTLGSDAHNSEQVGSYLTEAMETVRAAGLTHLTTYERRQARQVALSV